MKIALVHDYLNEYGGAEGVLKVLADLWPEAPIYTAFCVPGSTAGTVFKDRKIIESWFSKIPFYKKLYSPLRFLIPWIWGSFDFSGYDLVITSASWYITKGLGKKEICYCHTPPRWLYGYTTSVNLQKYWPVRVYALIVGHFLRMYDFSQAQKVTQFVANSGEVAKRIRKFYRREALVIYPPVDVMCKSEYKSKKNDYFLMVTRIVGGKGIELAVETAKKYGFKLKIAGEMAGFRMFNNEYLMSNNVEYLGRVSDDERQNLMAGAKGFLALSKDEDFGITCVEAMAYGTAVVAFNGGGYKDSVVDGVTGVLFDNYSPEGLKAAITKFNKLKWDKKVLRQQAEKFGRNVFEKKMLDLVKHI